ncbi:MAG: DUF885 family protein, partial [Pseudomonadota bacterium]
MIFRRLIAFLILALSACSQDAPAPAQSTEAASAEVSAQAIAEASDKANALFDELFMAQVMRSPIFQDFLGIKKDQDKWPDLSEARADEDLEFTKQQLARLEAEVDPAMLDETTALSLRLMVRNLKQNIARDR